MPIILGTFPVLAQVPGAERVFDTVFFIVVVSSIIPGSTLRRTTRWATVRAVERPTECTAERAMRIAAREAPAPILPLAAWGQERVADNVRRLRRTRIHVRVGAPLVISPGERTAARLQHDTERVMRALADLLPPAYRGVYAEAVDRPEPSMADVAAR